MKNRKFAILLFLLLFPAVTSWSYWVWSPEAGKFVNPEGSGQDSAEQQYDYAMQFYKEKNLDEAAKQLQDMLKKYPGARIASEAQYRLGTIHEEKRDFLKAFQAYKVLVESYPQSERFNEVIEREFRIGNVFLSGKKGKLLGLEILPSLPRAIEIFQHIVKFAPYSDYGDKGQFQLGIAYKKAGRFQESQEAFQAVIDQYPKSELVSKARFQLAETSFLKSKNQYRDQRALDEASKEVDRFLTHYPDSSASEDAAKLRQVIDEKNAEKNYRIGLYYEKENYLDSAIIYYSDASARYPHTQWGEKAAVRLKALKAPADFISTQKKELQEEEQVLAAKLKTVSGKDSVERDQIQRKLERLKKREKSIEKDKKNTLERRTEDLNRRKRELKEKFKNLEAKKKLMKKNPSEDFKSAMDRWQASLETEQDSLMQEEKQIKEWHQQLGVKEKKSPVDFIPFIGEQPTALEKVRRVEAKKLYQLSEEKKALLEEKETLYKHHGEVATLLQEIQAKDGAQNTGAMALTPNASLESQQSTLKATHEEIDRLEKELNEKRSAYEKNYGKSGWFKWKKAPRILTSSTGALTKSLDKSISILNPFDTAEKLEQKPLQELLERRMHLKEKIATQQNLTETLSQAFDQELALQEQKRLLASLEGGQENADPKKLRQSIKRLEKDIRSRYQEIEDRHERKKKLLSALDAQLKEKQANENALQKSARVVTAPAVGVVRFGKAFLFGLPDKGAELTKSASRATANPSENPAIKQLKDEIELESLMIEARSQEIIKFEKELEILKARASLAGGYKFRSSFVTIPYQFVGEAIESAKKIVPKKNRHEMIISRLNEETGKLEKMKAELAEIEEIIKQKGPEGAAAVAQKSAPEEEKPEAAEETEKVPASSDEKGMREEMRSLIQKLEAKQKIYQQQKSILELQLSAGQKVSGSKRERKASAKTRKQLLTHKKKLEKELKEIKAELTQLIRKESELEVKESSILEKRISQIDREMPKIHSKALSQDLLTERHRMEERVSQLESRRDFLSKELERFGIAEANASHS